jgi:beta-N-acetylhexosaminidase
MLLIDNKKVIDMNKFISIIIILLLILVPGCSKESKLNSQNNKSKPSEVKENIGKPSQVTQTPIPVDPIKQEISNMTLDEKIGQMVMCGIDGYTINNSTVKLIKNYHVGGIIILGENVKSSTQLLSLLNSLKTTNLNNKTPLFLSIDQEGGRVDRMPPEFIKLPDNKKIGKVNSSKFSYKIGQIIAEELKSFGFNMDFAPVLDINSNPKNPVIGNRSFGSNPQIVTKLGIETMKGIKSGGIISCVKHFPGHGDTSTDSHVGLPIVDHDLKRLKSFELIPFDNAVRNNVDAIMAAHILLPKIDAKYPSSMSKTIITDVLRDNLKYNGVVITDDMTMGAVTKNYDIGSAAVVSFNAGCDIILVCHGYDNEVTVINSLKKAVQNGTIKEERVNESLYRILKLKEKYKLKDKTVKSIDVSSINNKIKSILNSYIK